MRPITEAQAAKAYWSVIARTAEEVWNSSLPKLQEMFGSQFQINNTEKAKTELIIAAIAAEYNALQNIFPSRAERIYEGMIKEAPISDKEWLNERILSYKKRFTQSIEHHISNPYYSPLEEVAVELLKNWLGDRQNYFYVDGTEVISPVVTGVLNGVIASLFGFWKKVQKDFEFIDTN